MSESTSRASHHEEEIREALAWLNEATPRKAEFDRLVDEGAMGSETFTMKLDGDDLAGFCHAINVLYTHFGFDPTKSYWDQGLTVGDLRS